MTQGSRLDAKLSEPQPDVLVVGGGINGAGVFRELALQGVRVTLVEKGDFCSGSSAAPSRMIHGGLRYLEYGETKLVRESLHERDALLRNAPHYVRPIETVMPLYSWLKGIGSAIPKFFRGKGRPSQRGVLVVMIGLTFYDLYTRANRMVPTRSFRSRPKTLATLPGLDPQVVGSATYWDAWISYPERLALELILDAEEASNAATALNYVSLVGLTDADGVVVRDELSGEEATLHPRVLVNATGGWIDRTNAALGVETRSINGVKGSHLVIDDADLLADLDGRMVYFENSDQRICIVFPWQGRVLAGSTEVPTTDPDSAVCTPEETRYILDSLTELFPARSVDPGAIVSTFSGVRPLLAGDRETSGEMSRDYACARVEIPGSRLPVFSMAGGKWTTFRAFGGETADAVLAVLGVPRIRTTDDLPIGGGRDYPLDATARRGWLERTSTSTNLTVERMDELLERYGTRATLIAEHVRDHGDEPLTHGPGYSTAEVSWIIRNEKVRRLDDVVLRRTNLALLGQLSMPLLEELAAIWASELGLPGSLQAASVADTAEHLRQRYGIRIQEGTLH
jgi:glycerol-3-phosphate dehydrogenase